MHGASEEQVERTGTDSSGGAFVGHGRRYRQGQVAGQKRPSRPRIKDGSQISAADFMALVTVRAQRKAGAGNVPTASQISEADKAIRQKLATRRISVEGGYPAETMGCIRGGLMGPEMAGDSDACGAFWEKVKDVARSSAPILFKSVLPAAAVAAPVAALTARAMQPKNAPAAAPATKTVETVSAPESTSSDEKTQKVSGVNQAKPKTVSSGDDSKIVPYDVYRAEICRRAKILCNGGTPTAACMAKAQASVHADMTKTGVKVSIPGAKPGRATRGPTSSMMHR